MFSKEEADRVRKIYEGGNVTQKMLAIRFGVNYTTISNVINRRGIYK